MSSNINTIIHNIISYIPNEEIKFRKHETTGNIELVLVKYKSVLTVLVENTWDEIKRNIDNIMNKAIFEECQICMTTDNIQLLRCRCNKCASPWCYQCYINIFKSNKGIIKCPFCRYSYGREAPEHIVELGVRQILSKVSSVKALQTTC